MTRRGSICDQSEQLSSMLVSQEEEEDEEEDREEPHHHPHHRHSQDGETSRCCSRNSATGGEISVVLAVFLLVETYL